MLRIKICRSDALWVSGAGAFIGAGAAVLTYLGNPVDGGISIACFARDIAGALGFHQQTAFSYIRAEFIAIALGAHISSLINHDHRPAGGSSPLLKFVIGAVASMSIFVFVGCPLRLGLRLAGGDPAALSGLAGLIAGVWAGTLFLKRGYDPGKTRPAAKIEGLIFPAIMLALLAVYFLQPAFIYQSSSRHAPAIASMAIGAIAGVLAQRSKFCSIAGMRNALLIGDMTYMSGFISLLAGAGIANMLFGQTRAGVHIIGSGDILWNILSMACAGMGLTLLGGCPLRQLVLASQGNTDSALAIAGIAAGAAIAYNANIAFTAGSVDTIGKIAVIGGMLFFAIIGLTNRARG